MTPSSGAISDQQVLEYFAGKVLEPVSSPRMAMAATLAWELAEKADLGMSPWAELSPSTQTLASSFDCIEAGSTGAQPLSSVTPAIWAILPAICPGMTLQTSTFCTSPSTTTSIAAGRTSTEPPPKSGPTQVTMPS